MKVYFIIFFIACANNLFSQNSVLKELYGFRMSTSFIFFDVQDTSFTDNVVALDPKLLCFPGGFGNFYHLNGAGYGVNPEEVAGYNKGVKAKLARSLNAISRKKGHDENYIYDFIKLAKKTQSKVIFNINILNEPVEDYLKVIDIFKEHDLDVIAVELGGELYTREYKDVIDGELYLQLAKSCAKNIRENYPDILIGVVAAPVNTLDRHNIWNKKLSEENFYDAIIVHSYAKVIKGRAQDGKMVFEEQESENKKELFEIYRDRAIIYLQDKYPKEILEYNEAFNNDPVWITEWNFQMSKTTGNTMLQALFVPSYLLEILTNPILKSIELTTFHNMAGRTISASMLLRKKGKMHVMSSYMPMYMISNIFKNQNYVSSKEIIDENCYKYIFTDKNKSLIFWVNWSDKSKSDIIPNGIWNKREYYGAELYSTTFEEEGIYYDIENVQKEIELKPYSFTMIIENE